MNYVATGPRAGVTFWGQGHGDVCMVKLIDGRVIVNQSWAGSDTAVSAAGAKALPPLNFTKLLAALSDKKLDDPALLQRSNRERRNMLFADVLHAHGVTL